MRLIVLRSAFAIGLLSVVLSVGLLHSTISAQQPPPTPQIPPTPTRQPTPTPSIPPTPVITPGGPPAIPAVPKGVGIDVSEFIKQGVPERDLIDLFCITSRWQAEVFFGVMDATSSSFTDLQNAARVLNVTVQLPDVAALKSEGRAKLNDGVCAASTIAQAQKGVDDMLSYGNSVQERFQGSLGSGIDVAMKQAGEKVGANIEAQARAFASAESAKLETEIRTSVDGIVASVLAASAGKQTSVAVITAQITSQIDAMVAQKTQQLQDNINSYVNGLVNTQMKPLKDMEKSLNGMNAKIEEILKTGTDTSRSFQKQAADKRRAIITRVMDANLTRARKELEAARADLDLAKKRDPNVKNADDILAELDRESKALVQQINSAFAPAVISVEAEAQVKASIDQFLAKWTALAEKAKTDRPNALTIRTQVRPQLVEANKQLSAAYQSIRDIMSKAGGRSDAESLAITALRPQLSALAFDRIVPLQTRIQSAIDTLDRATVDTPIKPILDMLDSIMKEAESIKLDSSKIKAAETKMDGILIQAEDESTASVSRPGTAWDSRQENAAAGRTGWTGTGNWYLSREGDKLSYYFNVKVAGDYYLWVRDWDDDVHAPGARSVSISIDRKLLGDFPEKSTGGKFTWSTVSSPPNSSTPMKISLSAGTHQMDVVKTRTTSAAALIDAFFFATDLSIVAPEGEQKTLAAPLPEPYLIQAENEAVALVAKTGVQWDAAEEVKPSWRTGWTGTGDWYLSHGGDKLTYRFTTKSEGTFTIWVRDWADGNHNLGARAATLLVDGKGPGTYADPPRELWDSKFHWRKIGTAFLNAGGHEMTVSKNETTSAAAIMDAFFITNDPTAEP